MLPSRLERKLRLPFILAGAQRTTHTPQAHTAQLTGNAHLHTRTTALNPLDTYKQERQQAANLDAEVTPYFLRSIIRAEQDERAGKGIVPADYGTKWRATFRAITGDAPVCAPGDRTRARVYWNKLKLAIQKGEWTPGEWGQLHSAERLWRRRWQGKDARFEVMGTRRGRPSSEDRAQIDTLIRVMGLMEIAKRGRA